MPFRKRYYAIYIKNHIFIFHSKNTSRPSSPVGTPSFKLIKCEKREDCIDAYPLIWLLALPMEWISNSAHAMRGIWSSHPGEKRIYLLRERCCNPALLCSQILREFDCMASFNNALLQLCPASCDACANVSKVLVLRMWRSSFFSADFLSISICYPPLPIHLSGGTATSAARALPPPVPSARNEAVCKARQHPTP